MNYKIERIQLAKSDFSLGQPRKSSPSNLNQTWNSNIPRTAIAFYYDFPDMVNSW